jgi:hypothetical protein
LLSGWHFFLFHPARTLRRDHCQELASAIPIRKVSAPNKNIAFSGLYVASDAMIAASK